jgi:hypothetical protein
MSEVVPGTISPPILEDNEIEVKLIVDSPAVNACGLPMTQ